MGVFVLMVLLHRISMESRCWRPVGMSRKKPRAPSALSAAARRACVNQHPPGAYSPVSSWIATCNGKFREHDGEIIVRRGRCLRSRSRMAAAAVSVGCARLAAITGWRNRW